MDSYQSQRHHRWHKMTFFAMRVLDCLGLSFWPSLSSIGFLMVKSLSLPNHLSYCCSVFAIVGVGNICQNAIDLLIYRRKKPPTGVGGGGGGQLVYPVYGWVPSLLREVGCRLFNMATQCTVDCTISSSFIDFPMVI